MRKLTIIIGTILALLLVFSSTVAIAAAPAERVNILIGFDARPGPNEQQLVRSLGGDIKYTYKIIPAIAASVPQPAVQGLLRNPHVIAVEPEVFVKASDLELDNAWGVNRIGGGIVHEAGITGKNIDIAILDTGLDWTHPDLYQRMAGGYNFIAGNWNPFDDNGHGTHVAGIIAALDNDAGVVGVAPRANLWILKVLDSNGSGSYFDIIAALDWATGNNIWDVVCQITNNSYSSADNPGWLVQMAFQAAYNNWGQLHIAAAGNSGVPSGIGDNVEYPARFSSVVAVAATDRNDARGYFSSTGPDVELAAPGVSIMSTVLNGSYEVWSGTSMASPHVAGTAALVWASGITDTNHNSFINDEVRQRLVDTAYDLGDPGRDTKYGWGLVDAGAAVMVAPPPPPPPPPQKMAGVSQIETGVYSGKGRNKTYVPTPEFAPGDAVVFRVWVIDNEVDPLANATVEITITGPETLMVATAPSDSNGCGEATWKTQKPGKKGRPPGTKPGDYTAAVTAVTASGYDWDLIEQSAEFTIR